MNYLFFATLFFFPLSAAVHVPLVPKHSNMPCDERPYDVLGVGTAITDLLVPVSDEFLQKHAIEKGGSCVVAHTKIDQILLEAGIKPVVKPGGSCANMLKGLARLGQKPCFHLRDGIDEYGILYEKSLNEHNVAVKKVADSILPSGKLVCLMTPDKNRTFTVSPGAGSAFCSKDLDAHLFKQAKVVHLEGYSLRNGSLVEDAMKLAKEGGAYISFDPGCFQLVREHRQKLFQLMEEYIDLLFINEDELRELYPLSAIDACKEIGKLVPVTCVLLGSKGCLVGVKGTVYEVGVQNVAVVDTTGAGDLFSCGFLYGLLKGYDIEHAAKIGNLLGSTVVQTVGAEIPAERWQQLINTF